MFCWNLFDSYFLMICVRYHANSAVLSFQTGSLTNLNGESLNVDRICFTAPPSALPLPKILIEIELNECQILNLINMPMTNIFKIIFEATPLYLTNQWFKSKYSSISTVAVWNSICFCECLEDGASSIQFGRGGNICWPDAYQQMAVTGFLFERGGSCVAMWLWKGARAC